MNRLFTSQDTGRRFRYMRDGRAGTVQAPPDGRRVGIIRFDQPDASPFYHWLHVDPLDVEPLEHDGEV